MYESEVTRRKLKHNSYGTCSTPYNLHAYCYCMFCFSAFFADECLLVVGSNTHTNSVHVYDCMYYKECVDIYIYTCTCACINYVYIEPKGYSIKCNVL